MTSYLVIQAGRLTAGAQYTFKLAGAYRGAIGGTEGCAEPPPLSLPLRTEVVVSAWPWGYTEVVYT